MQEKHAVWRKSCYRQIIHKGQGERYTTLYDKALSAKNSSVLKKKKKVDLQVLPLCMMAVNLLTRYKTSLTRSQVCPFNREQWFYCQDIKRDKKSARSGQGTNPAVIMGTRERHHRAMLRPIYDQLAKKKRSLAAFLASNSIVLVEVIEGYEKFLCALSCPRRHHVTQANDLRWH